jgi:hypothetical protein
VLERKGILFFNTEYLAMRQIDAQLIRKIDRIMGLADDERAEAWGDLLELLGFSLDDFE